MVRRFQRWEGEGSSILPLITVKNYGIVYHDKIILWRVRMLLTLQGYFEAGRFIADTPIQIPEGRKTIVTVLDEIAEKNSEEARQTKLWNEIFEEIENCDEILLGEPERIHFRTPEEIDAL